uniref:Uncharacterized protein n=1 Tax=Caenorhabditis japonica TaxID=281687 RepID=A0A8R1E6Q6_CAEJA
MFSREQLDDEQQKIQKLTEKKKSLEEQKEKNKRVIEHLQQILTKLTEDSKQENIKADEQMKLGKSLHEQTIKKHREYKTMMAQRNSLKSAAYEHFKCVVDLSKENRQVKTFRERVWCLENRVLDERENGLAPGIEELECDICVRPFVEAGITVPRVLCEFTRVLTVYREQWRNSAPLSFSTEVTVSAKM